MDDIQAGEMVKNFPVGWIAFHDRIDVDDDRDQWYFVPKQFWEQHGHMPDTANEPEIENFETVMEYTWETNLSIDDAKKYLINIGVEILENPVWFWSR